MSSYSRPGRACPCGPAFLLSIALLAIAPTAPLVAQETSNAPADRRIEQLVVVGERVYPIVDSVAPAAEHAVDTAQLLRRLPGANLNANGMLTGIAQYRGLYGDRVAVSLDGLGALTGGPNAMDAPLSYASPLLLDHLSLERGIASVSSATESLGGHIAAEHDRGRHGERDAYSFSGKAQASYGSNGGLASGAFQLVGANETHKLALLGERDTADDFDYPGGRIQPTRLDRERYDLSYALAGGATQALVYLGVLDTRNTGTPSLPMDIRVIETDMAGLRLSTAVGARTTLDVMLADSSVDHVMDNYGVRTAPASPMAYRSTLATGEGLRWRIGSATDAAHGRWQIGLDGETAEHDATITNPNAAAFRIENFDAATRDVTGVYAQWNRGRGVIDIEAGVRVNRIRADAGPIGATIPAMNPMMQAMGMAAGELAAGFNAMDRTSTHDNVDVVLKLGRVLNGMRNVYVEVARKTRAPSYQELFLWLPLEATGGLADGRSYIGDPGLRSEVSREINLGSNWQSRKAWLAPQIFYKDISDYIQGVPSTNAVANMLASMMTGLPALAFANTDAEIYGVDLAWGYFLSDRLTLSGVVTSARGRRTDVADNLYRLAPLNGHVALTWESADWLARVEAVGFAAQRKVAAYNAEPETSGYGLLNASVHWRLRDGLTLSAVASNLLDRTYRDHLDGINRAISPTVEIGERLPGLGRNVELSVRYDW